MNEMLYCGDNLEYMKSMQSESVDLLYADILYGTGKDFVDYKDIKSNKDIVFDFYTNRLNEMYRILKSNGSIYLQCDTRINHWIRCIMDDIFGYSNFKNEISWKRRAVTNNSPTNYWNKNKDSIVFYTKSKNYTFNNQYTPLVTDKRYNKTDENGRRYQLCGIMGKGYNSVRTLIFNGKEYIGEYNWIQSTLDKRIKEGYVIEENSVGDLAYRLYLDESKGVAITDFWEDIINMKTCVEYETQKSVELMQRIIKASSNENDVLFDPFCGSGSFLVAGKLLNRNVIGCDINSKAIDIAQRRLINPTSEMKSNKKKKKIIHSKIENDNNINDLFE